MAAGDHRPIFESILEGLAPDGAVAGQMFGHPCIKNPAGKVTSVYWHDSLLVKLPPSELEVWLEEPDVNTFEPHKGRPMRGWANVPPRYVDEWEKLATSAYKYVTEQP
jgi:hypothetical protein